MSVHLCHACGCSNPVPEKLLFCRGHWFAVRKSLRDAIWREYREGQEISKTPSLRYLAVQNLAIAEVAARASAEEAARYATRAENWRERAIAAGHGDPLAGLERRAATQTHLPGVERPRPGEPVERIPAAELAAAALKVISQRADSRQPPRTPDEDALFGNILLRGASIQERKRASEEKACAAFNETFVVGDEVMIAGTKIAGRIAAAATVDPPWWRATVVVNCRDGEARPVAVDLIRARPLVEVWRPL